MSQGCGILFNLRYTHAIPSYMMPSVHAFFRLSCSSRALGSTILTLVGPKPEMGLLSTTSRRVDDDLRLALLPRPRPLTFPSQTGRRSSLSALHAATYATSIRDHNRLRRNPRRLFAKPTWMHAQVPLVFFHNTLFFPLTTICVWMIIISIAVH